MPKNDRVRLRHILDAAREAVEFAAGKTPADLATDRMRTLALTRCFEIIGEAAAAVSAETRDAHPQIPWRILIAMRNRLIHAYFDVNLMVVLDTAHHDLPPLIVSLETLLAGASFPPPETGAP